MVVVAGFALIICIVIWFFLVPNPETLGIYIEEMTENEALIVTATDEKVYERVIKNSVSHPEDVVQ